MLHLRPPSRPIGRGDDTVGNPRRNQIYQLEPFELVLLSKLDERLPVERFEATVSQSAVPSPPLIKGGAFRSFEAPASA